MKVFQSFLLLAAATFAHEGHDHDHEEDVADENSDVVVLTDATFPAFLTENPLSLIEFYAPWCGHCKQLKPEYELAATQLKGKAPLAKVDCTVEKATCEEFQIEGFPTLKIFRNKKPSDYKGQRTSTSIVDFSQLLPSVSELADLAALESFVEDNQVAVVAFFSESTADEKATFKKIADSLRDDLVFASTTSAKALKAHDVTAPAVVVYKKFDEGKAVYSGKFTKDDISKFIKTVSVPIMDEIGPMNYEKFMKSGLPMAYFFYGSPEDRSTYGPKFEKVAKDYQGKVLFIYLDAAQFGSHADNVGLKQEWPAFTIHDTKNNLKYPYPQDKKIEDSEIAQFVKDFDEGKLEPVLKSEEIPEDNNGPVITIVGKNFDEIVLDTKKDVLIEFYAPWCGHCKKLAPTWEELGTSLSGNENIVIAKCDGTANDTPGVTIEGFPTIILFKAESNTQVPFSGDRTVESFKAFLAKNAVHGTDIVVEASDIPEDDAADKDDHSEL
ncbi:protein disulfide-isomerase precursor [Globomyces sp. JEL0801]|nr:protein disulfide-isomerase precursor [Globomyces sp. JEL0801]